jgi:hypothetical protein
MAVFSLYSPLSPPFEWLPAFVAVHSHTHLAAEWSQTDWGNSFLGAVKHWDHWDFTGARFCWITGDCLRVETIENNSSYVLWLSFVRLEMFDHSIPRVLERLQMSFIRSHCSALACQRNFHDTNKLLPSSVSRSLLCEAAPRMVFFPTHIIHKDFRLRFPSIELSCPWGASVQPSNW